MALGALIKWLNKGELENIGEQDITVCADSRPENFQSEKTTQLKRDFDEIIPRDNSKSNVHENKRN